MDVLGQTFSPWAAALASCKEHVDLKMRRDKKKRQNTHFCLLPLRVPSCTSRKDCRSYYQLKLVREELLIFWVLTFSVHFQMALSLQLEVSLQTTASNKPLQLLLSLHYLPSTLGWHSLVLLLLYACCKVAWFISSQYVLFPNTPWEWSCCINRDKKLVSFLSWSEEVEFIECWQGISDIADR